MESPSRNAQGDLAQDTRPAIKLTVWMPWFSQPPYSELQRLTTVHLLQCDLSGHSPWFSARVKGGQGRAAADARKELARRIAAAVLPPFERISWQGDGGFFACHQDHASGDDVVVALKVMRATFAAWREEDLDRLHLDELDFRVSAHSCRVWIDEDPSYWSSPDLNWFLKKEREIAWAGSIAITEAIFEDLNESSAEFASGPVRELDGRTLHYNNHFDGVARVGTLVDEFIERYDASPASRLIAEGQRFQLGDAVVLLVAGARSESLAVDLRSVDTDMEHPFDQWEGEEWQAAQDRLLLDPLPNRPDLPADGLKLCPIDLRVPLSDFPIAGISYVTLPYSRARSFISLVDGSGPETSPTRAEVTRSDVAFTPGAPNRPGILVAHLILVSDDGASEPVVIACQRSDRQPANMGFARGRWSFSMEEQLAPEDESLDAAVRRGLHEELLPDVADSVDCQVKAIFVEESYLNMGVAVVCRTTLSFVEIHDMWQRARDRDEHRQIIGLPFNAAILDDVVRAGTLTGKAQAAAQLGRGGEGIWKDTQGWELHGTSPLRIALAQWSSGG